MMRALQILRPREFRLVDVATPRPGPDEVVVRLEYAAICNQNDAKIFYGLYGDLITYPCDPGVYGHEGVGVVEEVGAGVTDLSGGERVVMMLEGGPMLYSERVLRKADRVVRIDRRVTPEHAAVLELFGCAHHCARIAGHVSGRSVAVSGLGPAGLAILQMMALGGPADLIGIDPQDDRAALASRFGARRVVNPSDEGALRELIAEGVDLVIDATGVPRAILNSFEITRREVVIFGFTNEPFQVDQSRWFAKEMVIKNSKVQTIEDLRAAASLLEAGRIDPAPMVSDVMSFRAYDRAVERVYRKEAIKILLRWD